MVERVQHGSVALVEGSDGPVRFAFTERTGGVSQAPYESLNLGTHVGDDPEAVAENRRRVLEALGAEDLVDNLLVPNQVHGDDVVVVDSAELEALSRVRELIAAGVDAIVCTAPDVPVMLCFADCVPVVLTCPGGFAVVHSGWKGTIAAISAKAARILMDRTGEDPASVRAYIGPHILGDEYEVSRDLLQRFVDRFDRIEMNAARLLDLSAAIAEALEGEGLSADAICDTGLSTMRENDRFFSYRKEAGTCGRHAAVALMR